MITLKRIRRSRVLTQEALANASGVSLSQIIRLESGKSHPRPSTIRKLAKALRMSVTIIQAAIVESEEQS